MEFIVYALFACLVVIAITFNFDSVKRWITDGTDNEPSETGVAEYGGLGARTRSAAAIVLKPLYVAMAAAGNVLQVSRHLSRMVLPFGQVSATGIRDGAVT